MKFTKSEALEIIKQNKEVLSEELREKSLAVCRENFGNSVYVRGLIEFTNYCRITASIAALEPATEMFIVIGSQERKFWIAAVSAQV